MYFLRYSPRGFFLNRGSDVVEIDVQGAELARFPCALALPESQLSENFQSIYHGGRFYAAWDQTLYEFDGPHTIARLKLRRHAANCLFVSRQKLYFMSIRGEIYNISELGELQFVQQISCGFSKYQVEFCYQRVYVVCDGTDVYELREEGGKFQTQKLDMKVNGIWFISANILIDLDETCFDIITLYKYKNISPLKNDFQAMLRPLEVGWMLRKEYFDMHYGDGFEQLRSSGSLAFEQYFNELHDAQKRERRK